MNDWPRLARAGWPVVAGALVGLFAGSLWTFAQSDRYRADARVLVRGGGAAGVLPAVEALGESSILEENVRQTLRLTHRPRVRADLGDGGIVTLSVEAGSRESARQIDAEAAVVLTQLVDARFGSDGVEATVLDPAHPAEQTSPTPARNHLAGGLAGLGVGLAAALALARRRELALPDGADPDVQRRLRARVEAVAKRERAMAKRAGELAARESRLEQREAELAAARVSVPPPEKEPEPAPELASAPLTQAEPQRPPVVVAEPVNGRWNLHALEDAVRERAGTHAERYEEWTTYLFFLREHAGADGTLPPSFDPLVNEVFGELLRERA